MNDFINLVSQMRNAQLSYFGARKKKDDAASAVALVESKKLERQVDDFIQQYKAEKMQPKLF